MPEPDYKIIFYCSQSKFCDAIDQLRGIILKLEQDMRDLEEMVISDESEKNK